MCLKDSTEQEFDRLVQEGILEPVEVSERAAPIVPNKASKLDNYPIPKADDLFATLAGGQKFTKLDLFQACQQMLPDEDLRKC